jgi:putative pyrroloquinoline-quinone binding quinoprotein
MRRSPRPIRALLVLAVVAGLLLTASPASAAPGDWWQFGYTAANTRSNPNETTINQGNVGRLELGARQTPPVGVPGSFPAAGATALAVANGHAYVNAWGGEGTSGTLVAYRVPGSGGFQEAWRQRSGCYSPSPTVHLGIVFHGGIACRPSGDDGGVYAFDGATGERLWYSQELIGQGEEDASNVAATSGAVYFSIYANAAYGGDNALLSLDARTGAVRWQVAGLFGAPAVAGGRVFVGSSSGLQARSSSTGALLWSRPGATVAGIPAVTGGVVYSAGLENGTWNLFARSAATGALRWKRALPGSAGLAVTGDRVVAATGSGLRALDTATGTLGWSVAVAAVGSPAVANGLVYAGLQQGIGAWRLSDGARRWRFGTIAYGSPAVSGGRVYVSGVQSVNGQDAAVVDQFRLGSTATG